MGLVKNSGFSSGVLPEGLEQKERRVADIIQIRERVMPLHIFLFIFFGFG
jgi:hypothetical protein